MQIIIVFKPMHRCNNSNSLHTRVWPMKQWLTERKQSVLGKYRSVIREKAIDQAKVEIALAGKDVTDYNADQLEIIVKAQEDKIIQRYKNSTLVVFLLALGIY